MIVADRYTTSNTIHQCSKFPEDQWDTYLDWLFDYEYRKLGIPEPDLVIYLRVDPAVSQRLLAKRYEGHLEHKDIHEKDKTYLARCQKAATYCAQKMDWVTIECSTESGTRSIEEIQREIQNVLRKIL